ncbi:MAG: hypothetical protein K8T10_19460 [Candidatus Eremiobacteraeota bacterium]|nr:hypothetical protein [Candidatus Eremiobacteraeota bacterium]
MKNASAAVKRPAKYAIPKQELLDRWDEMRSERDITYKPKSISTWERSIGDADVRVIYCAGRRKRQESNNTDGNKDEKKGEENEPRPCSLCFAPILRTMPGNLNIMPNQFPYEYGAILGISKTCKKQDDINTGDLREILEIAYENPYLAFFYNGLGAAGASQEHFHIQGVLRNGRIPPIEQAPLVPFLNNIEAANVYKTPDYPIYTLVVDGEVFAASRKAVGIIDLLKEMDISFNMAFTPDKKICIIPRSKAVSSTLKMVSGDKDYAQKIGGMEVMGWFCTEYRTVFDKISKADTALEILTNALNDVGLDQQQQYALEEKLFRMFAARAA